MKRVENEYHSYWPKLLVLMKCWPIQRPIVIREGYVSTLFYLHSLEGFRGIKLSISISRSPGKSGDEANAVIFWSILGSSTPPAPVGSQTRKTY
ncbi:hypothetical protein PHYBLDRAFT_143365 [Phycomyces blakesleeanus NRRL 1555(-)]|uniref:Uncharacterized protein n=1 Tax=Phycomyces blakesleeanus (strain ATCC 8743b / DSM 1359 / FGSC 10004 / NBRC 33097 / NRRL 1555) TaxID=763407 RepID=A0A162UI59_PHYB8|nr:hypothetical protein PHYBLDRAFT_143365 [Phycomyces blakesleeanus NRRL 1555(-)]OAD76392.1 hypothetical protein PHYBLDRAFT_143365 [Phycomyces blakesleeanus NRRL 1555(-)]|eukprot:XP_018294432.1 hypothetical protein PHYBLDRAFT_143365 [Phycomyces blakesleeanus NRRL 1555(-)]